MKRTRYNIICAAAFSMMCAGLTSCDYVAADDRYIEGGEIEMERTVLLEDFTGQNCVNCPAAHAVMEQLEEQYGDKLIAVSIHCGGFGISTKRTNFEKDRIGLMTDEGEAIMETYGIQSWPMGVVDMGNPLTYDLWATAIRTDIQVASGIDIDLKAEYLASENDAEGEGYFGSIHITSELMSGSTRNVNLQYWIIESGIVAEQRDASGNTIKDYVHNNVFRAQVFNGIKGMEVSLTGDISSTFEGDIDVRWTDKEHWNVKNMAVVAIVSDKSGTLQAAKTYLFPKSETDK